MPLLPSIQCRSRRAGMDNEAEIRQTFRFFEYLYRFVPVRAC